MPFSTKVGTEQQFSQKDPYDKGHPYARVFGGITLRSGVVTTTANENERALLWRDSLWKKRSEPGRNQEESGEKLLRKLMRSQIF